MAKQLKNPFHPGENLREEVLEPGGITQAALAEQLGTSPKLWMNLQSTYDLDRAEKARHVA
jgi:plasmid maintenance system antidote protein VapI